MVYLEINGKNSYKHTKKTGSSKFYREKLYCQLETSNSSYYDEEGCVVDAISSFPYYDLPKNTNIFITCVNKQLGGFPGLSNRGCKKVILDQNKRFK